MNEFLETINPQKTNDCIKKILEVAKELNTPIIQNDAINLMIQFIKSSGVKHILEIGSAIGYSAIMMATFTEASVLTIERDTTSYDLAVKHIKQANLQDRIQIVNDDALTYHISEDYQCDLLFIDAAKAQYIKFFEKYEKHLNPKGIVICDNLLFHGFVEHPEQIESRNKRQLVKKIKKFIDYLNNKHDYDTQIYQIGDGISISIKK